MFKRGLIGAFILFPLFVSCGKDDFLTQANKALTDKVNGMDSKNAEDVIELNEDVIALYQRLVCAKNAKGLNAVKECF